MTHDADEMGDGCGDIQTLWSIISHGPIVNDIGVTQRGSEFKVAVVPQFMVKVGCDVGCDGVRERNHSLCQRRVRRSWKESALMYKYCMERRREDWREDSCW